MGPKTRSPTDDNCFIANFDSVKYEPSFCSYPFPIACYVGTISEVDILVIGGQGQPEAISMTGKEDCDANITFLNTSMPEFGRQVIGSVVAYLNGSVVLCGGKVKADQCKALDVDVKVINANGLWDS